METNSASCDYVKLYNGDKDTLAQSLQHIQRVSTEILSGITPGGGFAAGDCCPVARSAMVAFVATRLTNDAVGQLFSLR
jgi:hypothetical protein